jgi:hypothetical protein
MEKTASPTRSAFTVEQGTGVKPDIGHSDSPYAALMQVALAASTKCSETMLMTPRNSVNIAFVRAFEPSGWGRLTFLALDQVFQAVLCIVQATAESNDENGWIVIDELRVAERCKICACS